MSIDIVSSLPAGTAVYTVGVVLTPGVLTSVPYKGKHIKQRDVVLTSPNTSIVLTLWGKIAVQFCARRKVVVVRGAWVKEYMGIKNLSLPTSGSYEVEPKGVQGVEELMAWRTQQEEVDRAKEKQKLMDIISLMVGI